MTDIQSDKPSPPPTGAAAPAKTTAKPQPAAARRPAKPALQGKAVATRPTPIAPTPNVLPNPKELAKKARMVRRKRARNLFIRLALAVLLPTILAIVYFAFIASDQYESNTKFTIQTSQNKTSIGLETIIGGIVGSASSRDSWTVHEYILSREMLTRLNTDHQIIRHYQNPSNDFWSRLASDATFEEAYEYYLNQVTMEFDTTSGILTLQLRAYDPATAQKYTKLIMEYTEDMVNRMAERIQTDQVKFAEDAVKTAENRLRKATESVLSLQRQNSEFSPDRSAASLLSIKGQLESELAKAQAELNSVRAVMQPTAPQVIALTQKIQSLTRQIEKEQRKLVGTENDGLSSSIVQFETALAEKEFAQAEFESAMKSLEMAKLEASRKSMYLAIISSPSLPDEATWPNGVLGTLTVFLIALALYGILSLLVAAVREHARI